jgi:hypothetical protein
MDDAFERFAPLSEEEKAAGFSASASHGHEEEGELVSPIPPDAPAPPETHRALGKPSQLWTYRDASGEPLFHVCRFDPAGERKQFVPLTRWSDSSGALHWRWKAPPAPRPLYGLDRLSGRPGAPVLVCEGEKGTDAAATMFPTFACVTSMGGNKAAAKADWSPLAGCHVTIWPDHDAPGSKYAEDVARLVAPIAASVRIVPVPQHFPAKWDLADPVPDGADLAALLKIAKRWEQAADADQTAKASRDSDGRDHEPDAIPNDELEAAIKKLSTLSLAAYERSRAAEAKRLSVRTTILDKLVADERPPGDGKAGQGSPLDFPSPEPWPDPVDGAELLNELRDMVREYVVCSDHKIIAVVLWIVATWFELAAQVAPILNIRSPSNRCGKTTLIDLVGRLSKRALMAASITPAALFRTIEISLPTLIIDEADSFFGANDELRGVVDSGHTRQAAFVIRTVGEDHEPRRFSTWSFKAVSGIGKRAVTIEDRSIAIDLERKLRTEPVSRLRHAPRGVFTALQQKLCRWSGDNLDAAAASRPSISGALDDRQQDNWEILIAVADLAGGDWPAAARNAAISLSNSKEDTETLGVQLLHVKTIVASSEDNGIYSIELLEELVKMPERPWSEINRGKQMTQNRLAKMLGAFGLKTKNLRMTLSGGGTILPTCGQLSSGIAPKHQRKPQIRAKHIHTPQIPGFKVLQCYMITISMT